MLGSIAGPKTRRIVVGASTGALVIVAALTVVITLVLPRFIGGAALTVLSGSMTPTLPVGSTVIVRPVDAPDVTAGDIITYANASGRSFTTHRVEAVELTDEGRYFVTKGDANEGRDADPVHESALRGRVWFHVPYLGHLRDAITTPLGLGAIVGLAGITILWERASSAIRRRFASPSHIAADGLGAPPTEIKGAPQTTDVGPVAFASVPDTTDATATACEDDASLEPFELPGVTVDSRPTARVEQQLMVARLNAGSFGRGKVIEVLGLVRGHVVSVGTLHMVVSITGTPEHLDGVEELLRPYGLVEVSRSDVVQVGGRATPEIQIPRPPEPVEAVAKVTSLVLRPPVASILDLAGASPNGHAHEASGP